MKNQVSAADRRTLSISVERQSVLPAIHSFRKKHILSREELNSHPKYAPCSSTPHTPRPPSSPARHSDLQSKHCAPITPYSSRTRGLRYGLRALSPVRASSVMRARHCARGVASRGVQRLRRGGILQTGLGWVIRWVSDARRDALRGEARGPQAGRRAAEVPRRPPQELAPSIRLWVVWSCDGMLVLGRVSFAIGSVSFGMFQWGFRGGEGPCGGGEGTIIEARCVGAESPNRERHG